MVCSRLHHTYISHCWALVLLHYTYSDREIPRHSSRKIIFKTLRLNVFFLVVSIGMARIMIPFFAQLWQIVMSHLALLCGQRRKFSHRESHSRVLFLLSASAIFAAPVANAEIIYRLVGIFLDLFSTFSGHLRHYFDFDFHFNFQSKGRSIHSC